MVLYLSCEYFNSKCLTQNVLFYFALQIHLHKFSGPNSTEKLKIKNQETAGISVDFPPVLQSWRFPRYFILQDFPCPYGSEK